MTEDRISLVPYDPQWLVSALKEADLLRRVLADFQIEIEHVGSTAIPALEAGASSSVSG